MQEDNTLNAAYWNNRYLNNKTGWDIGYPNKIHTDFVETNYDKNAYILVPGAGNAYEVAYLYGQGYRNVYALDYAPEAKQNFVKRNPEFPVSQYLLADFFELDKTFDLVLEQTFFCAIEPRLRAAYVSKMHSILKPGGKIAGVLFNTPKTEGPPYGGTEEEYRKLFNTQFEILRLEIPVDSIAPRQGKEYFIEILKK